MTDTVVSEAPKQIVSQLQTLKNEDEMENKHESDIESQEMKRKFEMLDLNINQKHIIQMVSDSSSKSITNHKEVITEGEVQEAVATHSLTVNLIKHPISHQLEMMNKYRTHKHTQKNSRDFSN